MGYRPLLRVLILSYICVVPIIGDNNAIWHQRANDALNAYLYNFWNASDFYMMMHSPSNGQEAKYWTTAHGIDATLDGAQRTKGAYSWWNWVLQLYNAQAKKGWFDNWYDDESWMGQTWLHGYDVANQIGDKGSAGYFLNTAQDLMKDIMAGWDTSCCGNLRGGVWWDKQHTSKATVSNMGPAMLAARLYRATGNTQYEQFAESIYNWWAANMVNWATGQVCDSFETNGKQNWWSFTYNQGVAMGAAVELYQNTKNPSYLAHAHAYANFMINSQTVQTQFGPVLTDGCGGGGLYDCEEFKGIGYRNLFLLYNTDPANSAAAHQVLNASAHAIWSLGRDSSRNYFNWNWNSPIDGSVTVDDTAQSAATMALNIWALNFGPWPGNTREGN